MTPDEKDALIAKLKQALREVLPSTENVDGEVTFCQSCGNILGMASTRTHKMDCAVRKAERLVEETS